MISATGSHGLVLPLAALRLRLGHICSYYKCLQAVILLAAALAAQQTHYGSANLRLALLTIAPISRDPNGEANLFRRCAL